MHVAEYAGLYGVTLLCKDCFAGVQRKLAVSVTVYKPPSFSHCYIQSLVFSCQNQSGNYSTKNESSVIYLFQTPKTFIQRAHRIYYVSRTYGGAWDRNDLFEDNSFFRCLA